MAIFSIKSKIFTSDRSLEQDFESQSTALSLTWLEAICDKDEGDEDEDTVDEDNDDDNGDNNNDDHDEEEVEDYVEWGVLACSQPLRLR